MRSRRPCLSLSQTRRTALSAVLLAVIFVVCAWRPLWHTDLWGHLAYGRVIWQTGELPAEEPLAPLAAGIRFVDTAWLSQIGGFLVERSCGPAGLQTLFGGLIALIGIAWLLLARNRIRDGRWAAAGLLMYFWLDWYHLSIIRPQLAGTVCYVLLLWRLTARRSSVGDWFGIPLLFALWANLHGSFVMGLGLTGVFLAGRCLDLWRRTRDLHWIPRDRRCRRLAGWLFLATLAGLCNPYGPGLYAEVLTVGRCPNLRYLAEWQPPVARSASGFAFSLASIALALVVSRSPRRVRSWELLLLISLAFGGLSSERLLTWWAPAAAYLLVLHGHAVWRRRIRRQPYGDAIDPRGLLWTGLIGISAAAALACSPLAWQLAGRPSELRLSVSSSTPLGATKYLREHPPSGLVLNTYEWGDYLLWAGPAGLPVMVNSHAHLFPPEIWLDYLRMLNQKPGWRGLLDRYRVQTVVVDRFGRSSLIESLQSDPAWQLVYDDRTAVVLTRRSQ